MDLQHKAREKEEELPVLISVTSVSPDNARTASKKWMQIIDEKNTHGEEKKQVNRAF